MSSVPVPALRPSQESFFREGFKRWILILERELQAASFERTFRSAVERWSFASRKMAVQNVRDNNAAWVAGPSRICFVAPVFLTDQPRTPDIHSFSDSRPLLRYSPTPLFSP
jgi:hypothetical protein